MSERFGWLQQKALADPFAKRYAQAAKGVLVVLAALVFMVFAAFVIAYNPSTAEPSPKSTDPTWADNVLVVQIAVGFFVLGVITVLGGLLSSIKAGPAGGRLRRPSSAGEDGGIRKPPVLAIYLCEAGRPELEFGYRSRVAG